MMRPSGMRSSTICQVVRARARELDGARSRRRGTRALEAIDASSASARPVGDAGRRARPRRALRRRRVRRRARRRGRDRSGDRRRGSCRRRARRRAPCCPVSTSVRRLREQAPRVARVQADRRLVEHVERAGEPARRAARRGAGAASRRRRASRRGDRGRGSRGRPRRRNRAGARARGAGASAMSARSPVKREPRAQRAASAHRAADDLVVALAGETHGARQRARGASRRRRGTGAARPRSSSASGPPSTPVPSHVVAAALLGVEREPARIELGDADAAARAACASWRRAALAPFARDGASRAPLPERERAVERSRARASASLPS